MRNRITRVSRATLFIALIAGGALLVSAAQAESSHLRIDASGVATLVGPNEVQPPRVQVYDHGSAGLGVSVQLENLELLNAAEGFVGVAAPETPVRGVAGLPELPVVRRLFGVNPGAEIRYRVDAGDAVVVDLVELGYGGMVQPSQGMIGVDREKLAELSDDALAQMPEWVRSLKDAGFEIDATAYTSDAYLPESPVSIERVGICRDVEIYVLEVRPVACNSVRGTLAVWPSMHVDLQFDGGKPAPAWRNRRGSVNLSLMNVPRDVAMRGDRSENYLIIAPEGLIGSAPLNEFVAAKSAQGFDVTVYTATIGSTRQDIKADIEAMWETVDAPDYVLMVGDANDEDREATIDTVPICWGGGPHWPRTDLWYACMDGDGDWVPDFPIGRLPARTVAHLQAMVDKILTVESGDYADPSYPSRAALIAGTDSSSNAESNHEYVISTYLAPNDVSPVRVYAQSGGATTQDLIDAIDGGVSVGVYYGHSAGVQDWHSPPFALADVDALSNTGVYPLVVSFSCSSLAFHYTAAQHSPGLLEHWMRADSRGAAAAYGDVSRLDPFEWSMWFNLYKFFFETLYVDNVRELGPAYQMAAAKIVEFYGIGAPVSQAFSEEFYLLGDPSMRLPEPPGDNYLIIAAPLFEGTAGLSKLITAREDRGMNVMTYVPPSGTSNTAIKSYIESLWGTNDQPDYVVIVGDTDGYDSDEDSIPYFNGSGSKHAATDWPYVCMDGPGDWYPEIPIGRLSVRTPENLQEVVDKINRVESGNYPDDQYVLRGAFLANPGTQGQAEPTHDWVIDNLFTPNDYEGIRIYSAEGAGTQDVYDAINAGCLWVTYFGHSSSSGWWDPSFGQTQIPNLTNSGMYPVVTGWSCSTSHFEYDECVGETWVREPYKGAAAYISASEYIYWGSVEAWAPSVSLEKAWYSSFFVDDIWEVGPAWVNALYRFLYDHGGWDGNPGSPPSQNADQVHNFFEEFVILGDPALLLPRPNGFSLEATPTEQEVCAPASAVFDLNVQRIGEYADTVTLDVTGAPAGVTVMLSQASGTPPFTSVLTISDTDAAAAGVYTLDVSASGPGLSRSESLTLSISSATPASFVLINPPNGAVDVARLPELEWQAATDALGYVVEVAEDVQFANIVYTADVTSTSHTVSQMLKSATTYYWRAYAYNGCGDTEYTPYRQFETASQMDYYTEEFDSQSAVDLAGYTMEWVPNGSGSFYSACMREATELPTDPSGGTVLSLGDDSSAEIDPADDVAFYGVGYDSLWVNSNGSITFDGGDNTYSESLSGHFDRVRVSALWDDLNPSSSGTVSWQDLADRVVVTWFDVPQYGDSDNNTFQVEFFHTGAIHVTWLAVGTSDAIVGLSQGLGIPGDYFQSDLSIMPICAAPEIGACCVGESCTIEKKADCDALGGVFIGDGVPCDPSPCNPGGAACLIISEVVVGYESGNCPRFIEITNTGEADYTFPAGGLIVQTGGSADLYVDVDLTGVTIPAGTPFVIVSEAAGTCTGAFDAIYGQSGDLYTDVTFGYGNERFALTDTPDSSNLIDTYGVLGQNGAGTAWEFTRGYSYRLPWVTSGYGPHAATDEWFFGGPDSLAGQDPTSLLLSLTTPGVHTYDESCVVVTPGDMDDDGDHDADDCAAMIGCLEGPEVHVFGTCRASDVDADYDADLADMADAQRSLP